MDSTTPDIKLIPWDPKSPAHIERLFQQRVACNWDADKIESWQDLQRAGKKTIQWVVLPASDPTTKSKLAKHIEVYPLEQEPLEDSVASFGGKPRTAAQGLKFVPVGHISLDAKDPGDYMISTFYISRAIQGGGLGRAAMEAVERIATSAPLNAKTLVLEAAATVNLKSGAWKAIGMEVPKYSNEDWYGRMGYVVTGFTKEMWSHADATGKVWWFAAVTMKKDIR